MATKKKIKVLVTKVGLDGHDRGAKVVSSLLKEAGMEVIYLGMFQDVDVIGLSYLSGEHLIFTPKIVEEMKKNRFDDVLLLAGGTFPAEDIPTMEEMGIDKVFRAGSLTASIVDYIKDHVEE